ncbi:hypothetical protein F5Y16DRAFT_417200 [Xylariaceae sp. FL0255]|nr:hypothetical protein F5Y16DRAFT_417200 [Xylariaceae sp. FL0255]
MSSQLPNLNLQETFSRKENLTNDFSQPGAIAAINSDLAISILSPSARPSPCIKQITEFPNEILDLIFSNFHTPTTVTGAHCIMRPPPSKAIKNARLTCRKFCQAATRYLMDFISIEATQESLLYLKHFSNHPTIRHQIRVVHISFAQYNEDMTNYDVFLPALALQLQHERHRDNYDLHTLQGEDLAKRHALMGTAFEIEWHWNKFTNWGQDASSQAFFETLERDTLAAFEDHGQRYQEQERTQNDPLYVERIAGALARMTGIKVIMVNDQVFNRYGNTCEAGTQVWYHLGNNPSRLAQRYIRPLTSKQSRTFCTGFQFPIQVAMNLLVALSPVNFQELNCLFPFGEARAGQSINLVDCAENLHRLGKQLTRANFELPYFPLFPSLRSIDIKKWCLVLMSATLGAAQLQSLHLGAKIPQGISHHLIFDRVFTPEVLRTVLSRQQHGNLRRLILEYVKIDRDVLNQIVLLSVNAAQSDSKDKRKLHLKLYGVQLDENSISWAEALDLLRGHVDDESTIRRVWREGEEDVPMDGGEDAIFGDWNLNPYRYTTQADRYIRGDPVPNPMT